MNRVIAIGGLPATGKTTLVNLWLTFCRARETAKLFRYELLQGTKFEEQRIIFLGLYEEGKFDGTDRLSMQVQRDATEFIVKLNLLLEGWMVVFEGDRLFNASLLRTLQEFYPPPSHAFVVLHASEKVLDARHFIRADKQGETWKKSRETKYENLAREFPEILHLQNESAREQVRLCEALMRGWVFDQERLEEKIGDLRLHHIEENKNEQ